MYHARWWAMSRIPKRSTRHWRAIVRSFWAVVIHCACLVSQVSVSAARPAWISEAAALRCNLSVTESTVTPGESYSYIVSLQDEELPAEATAVWNGTKNGVTDINDQPFQFPILSPQTYTAHASGIGTYSRYATLRNGSGDVLCTTNSVEITIAPQEQSDVFVAAYYFPAYHADPQNEALYGSGWTEWEIFKSAIGRGIPPLASYPTPLWGYQDDSEPTVFETKIAAAHDHSVNAFIFDWYWYNGKPFLHKALEQGYMGASNNNQVKFSIMWANQDWYNYYSDTTESPIYSHYDKDALNPPFSAKLWDGVVPSQVDSMWNYIIDKYFLHPSYWKISGKPYFMIYDLGAFIDSLGGFSNAQLAFARLQSKAIARGLPGVHLAAANLGINPTHFPWGAGLSSLGISSITNYSWAHYAVISDYTTTMNQHLAWTQAVIDQYAVPYFPVVSVGWDSRYRCLVEDTSRYLGYPLSPTMTGGTPEKLRDALEKTKALLPSDPNQRVIFINAWNEWTEGSYVEPDIQNGYGYLEAVSLFQRAAQQSAGTRASQR
jgi:hypothetical protein